jgi:hypothetical protein
LDCVVVGKPAGVGWDDRDAGERYANGGTSWWAQERLGTGGTAREEKEGCEGREELLRDLGRRVSCQRVGRMVYTHGGSEELGGQLLEGNNID